MAKARTKRIRKWNATRTRKKEGGQKMAAAVSEEKKPYQSLETITPAQAKRWLEEKNTGNRGLRKRTVDSIARDILAGRWELDGSPIRFSRGGRLMDGQHRLAAVVQADRPVQSFVAYNLRDSAMDTIDRGNSRSLGDLFRLHHGEKIPDANGNRLAAVCGVIANIERGWSKDTVKLTFAEAEEVWKRYSDDVQWAQTVIGQKIEPGSPSGGAPVLGAFAFARKIDPDKLEKFSFQFKEGGMVGVKGISAPARALRSAVHSSLQKGTTNKRELIPRTLRCIEAFLDGEELQKAYVDQEVVDRMMKRRRGKR